MKLFIFITPENWNVMNLLIGPARIFDGLIGILTLGFVHSCLSSNASLAAARRSAKQRTKKIESQVS